MVISAQDNASAVIDQVQRKLGIFNDAGVKTGLSFALVNQAVNYAMQAVQMFTKAIEDSVVRSMNMELSLTRLTLSNTDFGYSVDEIKKKLEDMSKMFGVDVFQLIAGLQEFIREGHSTADSLTLLTDAEKLSIVTGDDLANTQSAMSEVLDVFSLKTKDAAYVTEALNEIHDTTKMNLSELVTFLGRAAPEIHKYGLSLKDVVDIMYTLSHAGVGAKNFATEFNKMVEGTSNYPKLILPDAVVVGVNQQFDKINKTAEIKWDKLAQTAVDAFGAIGDSIAMAFFDPWRKGTILNPITPEKILPKVTAPKESPLGINLNQIQQTASEIVTLANSIKGLKTSLSDLTAQRDYTIALHDATDAVQEQQDAIQKLQQISNAYSLSQEKNNLEIMKIQYAEGSRGPSRSQQQQIDAINKQNLGLQIKEQENQIAIGEIQQNGLQSSLDALDAIKRQHDEDAYNTEISNLSTQIATETQMWADYYAAVARLRSEMLAAAGGASSGGGTSSGGTSTGGTNTSYSFTGIRGSGTWLGGRQEGGPINQTGLYTLHQGEYVVPASGKGKGTVNVHVDPISITVNGNTDLDTLGMKIGRLISAGILTGLESQYKV